MVEIRVSPSATKLGPECNDAVVICGSHGGLIVGWLAAKAGVRAVILSDAGIGREGAGIAALAQLQAVGMAAATVAHDSARIGDGQDMAARGRISRVNEAAAALGVTAGMAVGAAAERLRRAPKPFGQVPEPVESRFLLEDGPIKIWGIDSASLVRPEDAGQVVLTGSHGALLGGKPETAIAQPVRACLFNDAGIGIDQAGVSRLPALDGRGIAAATLDAVSCRIGDARSAWEDGVVSRVNRAAEAMGARVGMTTKEICRRFAGR
ncbi:MAG: hypothetical protein FJX46_13190 [Alphaproteobacteria bacterium]|nr:hypothetical protein [Alphaproteobacteria bacterium]